MKKFLSKSVQIKKQVILVGPLPPPAGGMSLQTAMFSQWLKNENILAQIIATNTMLYPSSLNKIKGIRAIFRLGVLCWQLIRALKSASMVHLMANSGWSWYFYAMPTLLISKWFKVPVIVNYRGGNARQFFDKNMSRIRSSLKSAAAIVVPSTYLKEVFQDFGFEVHVIPNAVDLNLFKPSDHQNKSFHCVVARNLEAIYGVDIAISAFALALKEIPDMKLFITGEGPEESTLKQMVADLGISEAVTFMGRLDRQEMADTFSKAHLLINASRVDNMPNALLEAQACGVPILSTKVGGIPYMVEHRSTAILVPVDNVVLMSEGIVELCRDEVLRSRLRDTSLSEVKKLAWPLTIKIWKRIYHQVGVSIV